jgi:hypothetical protein
MKKYVAPGLVALAGVVFIVVTLTQNLFAVGTAFEEMIGDFRPALQDDAIATYRSDIAGLGAVAEEFQTAVLPGLAQALQQTPEDLGTMLNAQFPAVAAGMAMLPEAGPQFEGLIDTLASQQSNFASADAIPTKNLPAQTVPWGFTIIGVLAIGLGVWMVLKGTRLTAILALVLGALIVIGSFVLSLPGKSADADDLNEALEPVYTVETVNGAEGALQVIGAMGEEMQGTMLPALGQMLQMDQATLNQFFGEHFPAIAQAMQTFPETMDRFDGLVTTFADNLDNYDTLKPVKFTPIIWTFIIGGFVILLGGGLGLVWSKWPGRPPRPRRVIGSALQRDARIGTLGRHRPSMLPALRRRVGCRTMPGRDEIREAILGAAEGATGSVEALGAIGVPASIEDFDVEVVLGEGEDAGVTAVVRFSITAAAAAREHRSVA